MLFFLYIKSPARFHSDVAVVGLVLLLWLIGGYMNTSANIMAPSMVGPELVARASAVMALSFQVRACVRAVRCVRAGEWAGHFKPLARPCLRF